MVVSLFEAHFEFSLTAREAVFWKSAVPAVPFSARLGSFDPTPRALGARVSLAPSIRTHRTVASDPDEGPLHDGDRFCLRARGCHGLQGILMNHHALGISKASDSCGVQGFLAGFSIGGPRVLTGVMSLSVGEKAGWEFFGVRSSMGKTSLVAKIQYFGITCPKNLGTSKRDCGVSVFRFRRILSLF